MKINKIELKFELKNPAYIETLLEDNFIGEQSPIYPISIISEYWRNFDGTKVAAGIRYNYQIVGPPTDPDEDYSPLARIGIQSYPSVVLVFIEGFEDDGGDKKDWENVERMAREIFLKAQELNIIVTSNPDVLVTDNSLKPWEKVPDHYSDREIVELWHKGFTNSEIGKKIGLQPRTVTNTISKLRDKYGKNIVPTNEQRRRKQLKTNDSK